VGKTGFGGHGCNCNRPTIETITAAVQDMDVIEGRCEELGGYTVGFETFRHASIIVDTCPSHETYEAFAAGPFLALRRRHGLPDPVALEDHPVHRAFVDGGTAN
jgi:hypothetical protein